MFKVLIPAAALIGLVAVAAQPASSGVETQAVAQPMGWHLSYEGEVAKLAYGVANSDQLAMMMTCAPGDATVVVYGDVQPDSPRLTRTSNTGAVDPMSMGEAYETRIALNDPEIMKLAERGRMKVESASGVHNLPATEDERRMVAQFVSYCASSQA